MKKNIFLSLIFCLFLTVVTAQEKTEDRKKIGTLISNFKKCIETVDSDLFKTLFIEGKVAWVAGGSRGYMSGSPDSFMGLLKSIGKSREDFHNIKIWNDTHIGVVTFDYGFFEENKLTNWGKESWQIVKAENKWLISGVNFSMILPHQKKYPFDKKIIKN